MKINAGFERISKYANDESVILPSRKTPGSVGYDLYAAEDTVVPSYLSVIPAAFANDLIKDMSETYGGFNNAQAQFPFDLATVDKTLKQYHCRITLVPTGVKAYMPIDWYLQINPRSSMPYKHYLLLANGVGTIDSDYYNNPDNEGHIFLQLLNLLPFDVLVKKGDCIGQGVFLPYGISENETTEGQHMRMGGFGSTDVKTGS